MRSAGHNSPSSILPTVVAALATLSIADSASAYLALVRQGVESADVANSGDLFGYTVATGDFNHDGRDDLAIAAPWESNDLGPADHGLVTVNWGTSYGLGHTGAAVLSPGAPLDNSVKYGFAMAVGDFDGDGFDDLAIGSPDLDNGAIANAGSVWIYEGFAGGIQLAPSLVFSQNEAGGTAEAHDRFGFTLATGDFDDNGYDDLAVTAIGEDGDTGNVTIVYSVGPAGLATATAAVFSPGSLGFSVGTSGGWFGRGLAAGDLDQDGFEDLVIGAPKTMVVGIASAGRAYVLYGGPLGISSIDHWKFDTSDDAGWLQNTPLELGWSVAVGDFRTIADAGPLQIVAGMPGYELGGNDTGAFTFLSHAAASRGVGATQERTPQPNTPGVDVVLPNDRFGETMASGDFDGDGFDDLAIGALGNNVTEQPGLGPQADAGSVYLYGLDGGASLPLETIITHETLNDHVIAGDNLGRGLAFGRFEGGSRAALAAGAPNGDYESYDGGSTIDNTGNVYIHAPWRQPRARPHRGSAALDCQGYLFYAQRAWQRMRPASTTKTLALKLACDAIQAGQNPADPDTVPAWVQGVGGSSAGHLTGDILTFRDFMKTMMALSGNDAAMWLGARMSGEGLTAWSGWDTQSPSFADAMEDQAADYGMSPATSMTNAAGIDAGDHYTTPYDFAIMTFQAINEPCIKEIVERPIWTIPVQRLGAGGNPNQYGIINIQYANFFVNSVRDLHPSTVGMKGGGTPGALRTILVNSYVPLAGAHNAASGFGVWDDNLPFPGVVADCRECLGAELLVIAELYCQNSAFPDQITSPDPAPEPWAYLTGMSSAAEDTATGLVFNAEGSPGNDLGRQIQIDVMRTNQTFPTASVTALLRHRSDFCLAPDETQMVGMSPYQQHDGIRIINHSRGSVSLRITATDPSGYDQVVSLLPEGVFVVPPTTGSNPGPGFQLAVTHLATSGDACIQVDEIGYRSQLTLGNGRTSPDVANFYMDRVLSAQHDLWSLEFLGLDVAAGNLLDVSAHDPGLTTSVGDEIATAIRPVTSRLLPNVPNPFFRNTTIRFDLTTGGAVDLRVFDVRGRVIRTLASGTSFARGRHAVPWDGRDDAGRTVAPGVYFVKLIAGAASDSWRMLLLR